MNAARETLATLPGEEPRMKTTRCLPGDRCVIISDQPGCECNIGARVTVTQLVPVPAGSPLPPAWLFKDASRPLLAVDVDSDGKVIAGSEGWTTGDPRADQESPILLDEQLVPERDIGALIVDDVAGQVAS